MLKRPDDDEDEDAEMDSQGRESFIHFCIQSMFTPFDHSSMQEGDDEPMSYVHLG